MDIMALFNVLDGAATALIATETGRNPVAEKAFLEASLAAADAFPLGSDESQALSVILAAVARTVLKGAA